MGTVKWGIIGCGGIAHKFARSLSVLENGRLIAGASHTPGRAEGFAAEFGMPRSYTDYEALVQDSEIDAVYVGTTHNFHYDNVKLCLENGKHVLCEKPFAVNAKQASELIDLARTKSLFLMEAMWTRFLPAIVQLREVLDQGAIGKVLSLKADFCIKMTLEPEHRLRNKNLAGGALLDLGVYPIAFSSMIFGPRPERIQSSAVMDETGVDEHSFYQFDYAGGRTSQLSSSFGFHIPIDALICGTEGYIHVPGFMHAQEFYVHRERHAPEHISMPFEQEEGFRFEIAHAMECIRAGRIESDVMPLDETLQILQTMDVLRAQWGLQYPGE